MIAMTVLVSVAVSVDAIVAGMCRQPIMIAIIRIEGFCGISERSVRFTYNDYSLGM